MYNIRKGSIIKESMYGVNLISEVVSEVTVLHEGKSRTNRYEFQAKIIKQDYDGNEHDIVNGSVIDYLVGGTYGAIITVLEY
ncbi:hypothetical protein AXI64_gp039 [Vibrio phage qdvp001]|uniref:hypothetical protein n=1 Tax=Vibrio phage qdvp001 TaxID=1003177 RepID=UPI000722B99C|nr:hypothetical protein AXI64_gp039 [Vibrio phage qdvp001]ALM62031.1 hypothetical protein qdvp001_039 [Vibrio phage qdvp001]